MERQEGRGVERSQALDRTTGGPWVVHRGKHKLIDLGGAKIHDDLWVSLFPDWEENGLAKTKNPEGSSHGQHGGFLAEPKPARSPREKLHLPLNLDGLN